MRVRLPLSAKIIGWFFLNLALLALVALGFAQQKLRVGLDSLVAGPAGDRLRALTVLVVADLTSSPRGEWDRVLEKFGDEHHVKLFLFAERGREIAGAPVILPSSVAERMHGPGPPPRRGPPPPRRDDDDRPPENRPPPLSRAPDIIGLQRAGDPPQYWTSIHAPLPQLGPEGPAILVLESETLGAGGLIFDVRPLLWSVAIIIGLSVIFWLPLIRGITRSIGRMRAATTRIAEGRFDVAIDDPRRDELGDLGRAINSMSERIAGLVNGQRRFLSDVAHELCAPLSRLQLALGILETRTEGLSDVREEVDQISTLVNELLSFSRDSLGVKPPRLREVAVREILERALQREAVAAESVQVECDAELKAQADPDLLLRVLSNIVRNAIHHAANRGPLTITARREGGNAVIELTDCGPGIPAEALPQIFDPFYRVDTSRTRETGGVGLGLSIAKRCIEACGGTISLRKLEPTGLGVRIVLALA